MHGEGDYSIAGVQPCYTASIMKFNQYFGRRPQIEGKRNLNVGVLYYKKYIAVGRAN